MKYLITAILCTLMLQGYTQIHELSIGDTVPDITLTKIFRLENSTRNLKSFYKKILVLDFWATWCEPCVKALPRLDSLQKKFSGIITLLPVSDELYNTVKKTMLTNKSLKNVCLPSVTEDKKLASFFKHRLIPHDVWINEKGIVIAITSELEITEENIRSALDGNTAGFPCKQDEIDFDLDKPIIRMAWQNNDSLATDAVRNYSVIVKQRPGLPSSTHLWVRDLEKTQKTTDNTFWLDGITCVNCSVLGFFIFAYDLTFTRVISPAINPYRVILDVDDTAKYRSAVSSGIQPPESYQQSNSFSYEMKLAKAIPDTLFAMSMIADLNRHFDLKGRIVQKEVPCWFIVKKDKRADSLRAKPGTPQLRHSFNSIGIRNKYLSVLLSFLNVFNQMEPVIDQTGIQWPIDLDLDIPLTFNTYPNIDLIRSCLNKAGLDMVKGRQKMNLLYLTDKPENYHAGP